MIFAGSMEELKTEIDFIHSSGALQHVHSPYEFTNSLIGLHAKWILVSRMMFNENDRDFVTVQKSFLSANGPGKLPQGYTDKPIMYPHTTLSFQKFNSTILNKGYEAEWMFSEAPGSYQRKNEKIIEKGLLYIRK